MFTNNLMHVQGAGGAVKVMPEGKGRDRYRKNNNSAPDQLPLPPTPFPSTFNTSTNVLEDSPSWPESVPPRLVSSYCQT